MCYFGTLISPECRKIHLMFMICQLSNLNFSRALGSESSDKVSVKILLPSPRMIFLVFFSTFFAPPLTDGIRVQLHFLLYFQLAKRKKCSTALCFCGLFPIMTWGVSQENLRYLHFSRSFTYCVWGWSSVSGLSSWPQWWEKYPTSG